MDRIGPIVCVLVETIKQHRRRSDFMSKLKERISRLYYHLKREPPITNSAITKELIGTLVSRPDPIILEIGCNDGDNTRWFLEIFKSPTIFCFEPDPRATARFKHNLGEQKEISLYEYAIGSQNGEATFYMSGGQETEKMPEGWDLSGSIRKPKNHLVVHQWCTFEKNIPVQTKTLDTWCAEQGIDRIDFIWMDVQGAEMDVISGGRNALQSTRFLYTEYNNNELYEGQPSLKQLLKELAGFDVVARYPDDILLKNKVNLL